MPTAVINGNVVNLTVNAKSGTLNVDMSLQRHHYRYCSGGVGQALNSLLYYNVTDQNVLDDATDVGKQMERLLNKNYKAQVLFGVSFQCTSGRAYLVDNTGLNPKAFPNHFFVATGPSVWKGMKLNQYTAAVLIRRVQEAIQNRSDKDYRDPKVVHKVRYDGHGGQNNPVILAYIAAHTHMVNHDPLRADDDTLKKVSGEPKIVEIARTLT